MDLIFCQIVFVGIYCEILTKTFKEQVTDFKKIVQTPKTFFES